MQSTVVDISLETNSWSINRHVFHRFYNKIRRSFLFISFTTMNKYVYILKSNDIVMFIGSILICNLYSKCDGSVCIENGNLSSKHFINIVFCIHFIRFDFDKLISLE